jgi:hypothetical protein
MVRIAYGPGVSTTPFRMKELRSNRFARCSRKQILSRKYIYIYIQVLLSYLCYEDRRLNPTNLKLLDDLLSKRRHYDSDSSDSEEEEDKDGFD